MNRRISVKILSLMLCLALLVTAVPVAMAKENKTFSIATINDTHYYTENLAGNKKEAFYTYLDAHNCVYDDLDAILDAALESLSYEAANNGVKHIVVTGDLTTNGEYESHKALAEKFRAFEEKSGAKIYVTPGNHDINNPRASSFVNDIKEEAKQTTPAQFYEIYKDLGFSDAYHKFSDFTLNNGGSLSYSVKTGDGYRLILADGGKYTEDTTESGEAKQETAGAFSEALINWILDEAEDAKKNGETPLLFTHWNMAGANYFHEFLMQGFVIDDAYKLQELFADAGINYSFGGHQHISDISITYSDSGNPMYSVITPTLTQFPFSYRVTDFTKNEKGGLDVTFNQKSCDEYAGVEAISGNGTYPSPYRKTGFFKQFGGHSDASDYIFGILKNTLDKYINGIRAEGSVVKYIEKELDIDIEKTINSYLLGGIQFDKDFVIDASGLMSFLYDIDTQIMTQYIYQKSNTYDVIRKALDNLMAVQVSDVPCEKYINEYGFGNKNKGGTLGDAVLSVIACMYPGNEDISDDYFLQDVVEFSGTTEFIELLIASIKEYVVEDVLVDNILSNIDLNFETFFDGEAKEIAQYVKIFYMALLSVLDSGIISNTSEKTFIDSITSILSDFDNVSLKKLVSAVLATGLIPYGNNISELVDSLVEMFLPLPTKEAAVYQAKIVIGGMVYDDTKDWDVTYTNNGAVKVVPTKEDMQLPVNVTITMAEDNSSGFTVNWLTKYSITASDIEVVKKGEDFTGTPLSGEKVKAESKTISYSAPGFNAGSIAILPWTRDVVQHTVTVYGLETDTEYIFRIGDFEKGFTADGSIKTAPHGTDEFSFINISATGSTVPDSYKNVTDVLDTAEKLDPDYSFAVHTGNLVPNAENDDQWTWAITAAEKYLTSKPFVYTPGTLDAEGEYTVIQNFPVAHAPKQLTDGGIYYSYDYANAHFIVLNTNNKNSAGSLSKEQSEWLKEDLSNSHNLWNIVIMHESIYGNANDSALHSQMAQIMEEYDIDLILAGNEKIYARSYLLDGDDISSKTPHYIETHTGFHSTYIDKKGTVVVVNGTFTDVDSTLYYTDDRFDEVKHTEAIAFSRVSIKGDMLTFDAYTINDGKAEKVDSFGIRKNKKAYLMGDIDADGSISAADARLALRYSVALEQFSTIQRQIADTDFNNKITAADARQILRTSVNLQKLTPEYIYR